MFVRRFGASANCRSAAPHQQRLFLSVIDDQRGALPDFGPNVTTRSQVVVVPFNGHFIIRKR